MKNMLILGGNSSKNISWINTMNDFYKEEYNVKIVEYDNWYNEKEMDFDKELEKVGSILGNNNFDIVLAKSIGLVIICYLYRKINIKNKKIVFMGYPKMMLDNENISIKDDIYKLNKDNKLLIVQQENDPLCSYEVLNKELDNVELLKVDGNDHSYNGIFNNEYLNKFVGE